MLKRIFYISAFCFLLSGCSDLFVNAPKSSLNMEDFSALTNLVSTRYPFLHYMHINWDSLTQVYRPIVAETRGDEIFSVFDRLLANLKDGHVEIITKGGDPILTYDWPRDVDSHSYSPLVVRKYFTDELLLAANGNMEYGILPGNIGYCYISTFGNGNWAYSIDTVLRYLANTEGMIVDVRNNPGGSGNTVNILVGRFTSAPISYSLYLPDGTPTSPSTIVPSGKYPYHKPVVVLINGASFSAAEMFADYMERIPYVTTVGDTTGGGGGATDKFTLPSGMRIQMPIEYFTRADGQLVQWIGVPPMVYVEQTAQDVARNRDPQLERAVQLLHSHVNNAEYAASN